MRLRTDGDGGSYHGKNSIFKSGSNTNIGLARTLTSKHMNIANESYGDGPSRNAMKSYSEINLNNRLTRKLNAHNMSQELLETRNTKYIDINKEVGYPF